MCTRERMKIIMENIKTWVTIISAISKVIRHMNARKEPCMHQYLKGHCFNCKKYGHRAFECRSNPMWSLNKLVMKKSHTHHYNWDYNTRQSCIYCQEYGYIPENYIRTHLSENYNRWLSQTTCFSCHKTCHVKKNCPTMSKAHKSKFDKGKT